MEQLFRDFWWLVFPLAWVVAGGVGGFLKYQRQKQALDLLRTYAEQGQEPPKAVVDLIQKPLDDGDAPWAAGGGRRQDVRANYWSLFGLFTALAVGFAGAAWFTGLDGGSGAFLVVAFTMGAVAVWALINALLQGRGPR